MNLKLTIMKLAARTKRKKDVWKTPVGERFLVPRDGKKGVDVLLYSPQRAAKPWPVLFNIHGGGWVGCDASQMDSYCLDMAEKCGAFIVNINYTKLDVRPFPYPQEEIRDTVLYFRKHAEDYGVDPTEFVLIGYSAGGHLAAASALMLHDLGVELSAEVLCYPFLDFTKLFDLLKPEDAALLEPLFFPDGIEKTDPAISPVFAKERQLKGLAPTVFVCCGPDPLTEHAKAYREKLEGSGVPVSFRLYEEAMHGFIEVNHKEYPPQEGKNARQEALARDAETYIAEELRKTWNGGAK